MTNRTMVNNVTVAKFVDVVFKEVIVVKHIKLIPIKTSMVLSHLYKLIKGNYTFGIKYHVQRPLFSEVNHNSSRILQV